MLFNFKHILIKKNEFKKLKLNKNKNEFIRRKSF